MPFFARVIRGSYLQAEPQALVMALPKLE